MKYTDKTREQLISELEAMHRRIAEIEISEREHSAVAKRAYEQVERLKKLSELSLALTGDPIDVFNRIANIIGELLDVPIVNLAEIVGAELKFLSTYIKGETTTYAGQCLLNNTPCATVLETKDLRVYHNVSDMFPEAVFLKQFNAFSYCGFPAIDGSGKVAAVICILDDKQHDFSEEDRYLLQILAQRVGLEIERQRHINERKRAEEEKERLESQLRQSQKMEAVGQLAGGIAHDFNNLLTVIMGYGGLLQNQLEPDSPLKQNVTRILRAVEKAGSLIQSLLAFSRKQVINTKPANLNDLVKGLEELLLRIIREDIDLKIELNKNDLLVMIDAAQIEQALINLVANARDAMPDGGVLTITSSEVDVDEAFMKRHAYGEYGSYALITVTDTGTGMDKETMEKIFEPFFTTKEVGKGTGLGLAIAFGIINQHNGFIDVYSEAGEGTSIKIYLPLIKGSGKSDMQAMPYEAAAHSEGGTETLLVAEDNPQVREIMKDVLEGAGYTLIEAVDGEDAVEKFRKSSDRAQLVILDVIMPKKNGKEVYETIRKIRPDIKVIFTSGYTAEIISRKGVIEEGLNFISKPVSPNILLRKVREVLDV